MRGLLLFISFVAFNLFFFRLMRSWVASRDEVIRERASYTVLFVVFLVGLITLFQVNIIHDAFQYYGYLVSACMDGDLNLFDEIYIHNANRFYNPFPISSSRYIGTAVLESPFFFLGHMFSWLLKAAGDHVVQNGYSFPYLCMVSLASPLFGFAGLLFCYLITRVFYSRAVSLIAIIGVWLASPMVFFMFTWNGWAHPFEFCLISSFIYLWLKTRGERTAQQWLLLGVIGGVIGLVRPFGGIIFLLPIAEVLSKQRAGFTKESLVQMKWLLLCGAMAFLMFTPQLSIWKAISGEWLSTPYAEVGDSLNWLKPDLLGVLFSVERHGLFAWTPLLLPAIAGLWFFLRRDRFFATISTVLVVFTIYFYSCWSIWWTGIGFSNRFFISLTPFFILGLAGFVDRLRDKMKLEYLWGFISLFIIWNIFLIGEYRINIIPQGIPDPHRVVDEPLTFGTIVNAHFNLFPDKTGSLFSGIWINENFFATGIIHSFKNGNVWAFFKTALPLVLVIAGAYGALKLILCCRDKESFGRAARVLCFSGVAVVLCLHLVILGLRFRSEPMGEFYHFDEINVEVSAGGEDVYYYSDYPLPVRKIDLLTSLTFAHAIPYGDTVAEVTLTGRDGTELTKRIICGEDTVEASVFRPESAKYMRHHADNADIVRLFSGRAYSGSYYEHVVCRKVIELPVPMVVNRIRVRYLYSYGNLLVSDIFLRDF